MYAYNTVTCFKLILCTAEYHETTTYEINIVPSIKIQYRSALTHVWNCVFVFPVNTFTV